MAFTPTWRKTRGVGAENAGAFGAFGDGVDFGGESVLAPVVLVGADPAAAEDLGESFVFGLQGQGLLEVVDQSVPGVGVGESGVG